MPALEPVFARAFPGVSPAVYARDSFFALWLSHAGLVALSTAGSAAIGLAVAIFVTREAGREFRPIVDAVTVIGQSFPPAAILALAVPAVGFGAAPTLIALTLYGLLPIIANATAGIDSVPADVKEAAVGIGFSPAALLWKVELVLAAPAILAGLRTSVAIAIGTATIGSTVGALTLGAPIISGLYGDRLPWVIQGAVVVGLFAILTDMIFERLARRLAPRRGV
jgi:osmoprotectant transport system permease protein